MAKKKTNWVKFCDDLPLILKVILALPGLDLFWNIYRFVRSWRKANMLGIILALLLIFVGWAFMWIVDIITLILSRRVIWIC